MSGRQKRIRGGGWAADYGSYISSGGEGALNSRGEEHDRGIVVA